MKASVQPVKLYAHTFNALNVFQPVLDLLQEVRGHNGSSHLLCPLSAKLTNQITDGGEGMVIVLAPLPGLLKLCLQLNNVAFNIRKLQHIQTHAAAPELICTIDSQEWNLGMRLVKLESFDKLYFDNPQNFNS